MSDYTLSQPFSQLYPHVPSSYAESPFRVIVGVCYEAFTGGEPEVDPERAIKAYLRQCKIPRSKRNIKTVERDKTGN